MKPISHLRIVLRLAIFAVLFSFSGCNKVPKETSYTYEISKFRHSYLALYQHATEDHLNSVYDLTNKSNQFVIFQNINFFEPLRNSWRISWRKYQLMKPFYFMNSSSISNPINYNELRTETFYMNPSYIDATLANPNSGIIVNPAQFPIINSTTVSSFHSTLTNDKAVGYQVLEFLLWGEDNSTFGGGIRSHYDFNSTSETTNRRRAYLNSAVINLLEEFSTYYSSGYEQKILAAENDDFMRYVLSGLITFIEDYFAEQALNTPYQSLDLADETSEFSENTINDLNNRLFAIELILKGETAFEAEEHYFLIDLIRDVDGELAKKIENSIEVIRDNINSIDGHFDNAILTPSERVKINNAYLELLNLADLMKQFGTKIGVNF